MTRGIAFKCDRCGHVSQPAPDPNPGISGTSFTVPFVDMPKGWLWWCVAPARPELTDESGHLCPGCANKFHHSLVGIDQ